MRRFALSLLASTLLLAGCVEEPLPMEPTPLGAVFDQVPGGPVVNSLSDDGDGTCTDAKCTLRDAIAFASPGATITFSVNGTITLAAGELAITRNVWIQGPGASLLTVSANGASRVFQNLGTTTTISGLTITGGNGGGGFGGGLRNGFGVLSLIDCVVRNNQTFTGAGGGLSSTGGELHLNRTTVMANTANEAGGIYIQSGVAVIRNSTISGNSGPQGEGIRLNAVAPSALTLINSTVSGNTTANHNSAIRSEIPSVGVPATVTLINSTITDNRSTNSGSNGAVWLRPGSGVGTLMLVNTIVSANTAGGAPLDIEGTADGSSAFNLIGAGGGLVDGVNGNLVGIHSPQLGPLTDNGGPTKTHALLAGSPAIDAGSNALALDADEITPLVTDQRGSGFPRIVGGTVDIGAFELADLTAPIITPTVSGTLGLDGWYVSDVTVSWSVVDNESGISLQTGCGPTTITADTGGVTLTCEATSAGGTASQSVTIKRDATPPTLSPTVSPNPVSLKGSATATPNADDDLSGVATSSCPTVDTATVGSKTLLCTATDQAGNTASASVSYSVHYVFEGFGSPINNGDDVLNGAKAGQSIPLKWRLTDALGNPVTTLGTAVVTAATLVCSAGVTLDNVEELAAGNSGLQNQGNGYYQFNWKTPASYANSCKTMHLNLFEGDHTHTAQFQFRK